MKIAICMHGVTGGCGGKDNAGDPVDIEFCKRTMGKRILSKNPEIDFFIHSWTVDRKEEILNLYNPKKVIIEPQKIFSDQHQWQLANSRWYSMSKALELKKEYECINEFKYDVVMTSRFDIVWMNNIEFKYYNMAYFWASLAPHKNDVGEGKKHGLFIEDFFFFSSSDNMDRFSKISENVISRNNHKMLYNFLENNNFELQFTLRPPVDYDLYRWWSGKDQKFPNKWYNGVNR